MPPGELRGRAQGAVGERHAVMLLVTRPQPRQDLDRLVHARLLEDHALQPPRQPAVALDLLELVERRRPDQPEVAGREQRLDQHREVHRAAGGGAGPHRRVHLVDEENGQPATGEGVDDRLEAFLEVTPEPRAGEQRGRVEGEDLGALQARGDVVFQQPARQSLGEGGLADARLPHEDRVVLAPAAEDLQGASQFVAASDQGVEPALPGALGQVDGEGRERIARGGGTVPGLSRRRGLLRTRLGGPRRRLGDPVRDVVQDVEPGDVLRLQQLGRVGVRLLQDGGQHVPEKDLVLPGALDVEHRRLQDALKRQGLLRLALPALPALLEVVQERVERVPQRGQVAAAGGEDLLPFRIMRQHVQQVLEGQVRVPANRRLAVGDVQDQLDGGAEHGRIPSLLFEDRLEGESFARGEGPRGGDLGLGDLVGIGSAPPASLGVDPHHDSVGFRRGLVENGLQHLDDELHRRVVVVQERDLIADRLPGLLPGLVEHAVAGTGIVRHTPAIRLWRRPRRQGGGGRRGTRGEAPRRTEAGGGLPDKA